MLSKKTFVLIFLLAIFFSSSPAPAQLFEVKKPPVPIKESQTPPSKTQLIPVKLLPLGCIVYINKIQVRDNIDQPFEDAQPDPDLPNSWKVAFGQQVKIEYSSINCLPDDHLSGYFYSKIDSSPKVTGAAHLPGSSGQACFVFPDTSSGDKVWHYARFAITAWRPSSEDFQFTTDAVAEVLLRPVRNGTAKPNANPPEGPLYPEFFCCN